MAGKIDARLAELGITPPEAAIPAANYVPAVTSGSLLFIAGQITTWNGEIRHVGKVGRDFSVEEGQEAARLCGLNILAQARAALGDLDRVARVVKLGCFVNSAPDFSKQPQVANGVSDLMVEVFGDGGRHARFAVGAASLPFDVAVEVDAVLEVA